MRMILKVVHREWEEEEKETEISETLNIALSVCRVVEIGILYRLCRQEIRI